MKFGISFSLFLLILLHSTDYSLSSENETVPEYLEELPNKETDKVFNVEDEDEEEEEKDPLLVTLPDFGQLRGYEDVSTKGKKFFAFEGIPYAKPPVGELRFKNPDYLPKWEGVRDALTMPEPCPQFDLSHFLAKPNAPYIGNEDCLYLNIYTPMTNTKKFNRPVLVYLHGGRYISGSASDYLPHKIMNEDVVLVVVQYRLGILGFLSTEDSVMPGNLGLKDQTLSFRWITRYVEYFGGDSLTTTLVGSSAGAAMAHFHTLTHHNLGLFSRVILQSGTALCPWAMGGAHKEAAHYLGQNLCQANEVEGEIKKEDDPTTQKNEIEEVPDVVVEDGRVSNETSTEGSSEKPVEEKEEVQMSSEELMECLQKIDAKKLTMFAKEFFAWTVFPVIFGPYVDGNYLVASPEWLLQQKRHKRMDMIVGINKHDGGFITNALYANEGRRQALQQMFSSIGPVSLEFTDDDIAPLNMTIKAYHHYNHGLKINPENADNLTRLYGDRHYAMPSDATAIIHAKNNEYRKKNVFFYELHHRGQKSTSDIFNQTIGTDWVSHGDEKFLLFPSKDEEEIIDENDEKVSEMMIKMWVNFAAIGIPTPDESLGFKWTPFTVKSKDHLAIKVEPQMEGDTRNETRHFWNNLPTKQNLLLHKRNFPDLVEQDEQDFWDEEDEEEDSVEEAVEETEEKTVEVEESGEKPVEGEEREETTEVEEETTTDEVKNDEL